MKKKIITLILLCIAAASAGLYYYVQSKNNTTAFTFGNISKGDLQIVITSSGTLQALSTVEVGTQVSGKISRILVDFNSEVKRGQLLAVLDTVTLAAQLRDAEAALSKAKAEYKNKNAIHGRNNELYKKQFLSELEFIQSNTDLELAKANLQSAESALDRAKVNLGYAYIYAPISGRIINRAIEQGQTVAANFSAPTLFTIAEDLGRMRIMTNVDESDIGQIKQGQNVSFTVQSYNDKTFKGTVSQIRLNASVVSNVVNYTVVVLADNKDGLLLPGMTATVDFSIESRSSAMLVPNAALKFRPTPEMVKTVIDKAGMKMPPPPPGGMQQLQTNTKESNSGKGAVWYLDQFGVLRMVPVTTGITDGKKTELVSYGVLKEGMQIITGTESTESSAGNTSSKTSTLTGNKNTMDGPPGPPPF